MSGPRVELAAATGGLLHEFNTAGVLGVADVRVAQRLAFLYREQDERGELALALTVRALRAGSICIDPFTVRDLVFDAEEQAVDAEYLPWPEPGGWLKALEASPLVTLGSEPYGKRPLRLDRGLLYLERYWAEQEAIRTGLEARRAGDPPAVDEGKLASALDKLFDHSNLPMGEPDRQKAAGESAARSWVTVVIGGPGTGKTSTVARILALLLDQGVKPGRIALAAPTGKAAARLEESVRAQLGAMAGTYGLALSNVRATTLHKLLGWQPPGRYKYNAQHPLPHEAIVVDEMSMVSLPMTAHLLAAARPDARLVLVGDPDQLASVEAGAVLADITSHVDAAGADDVVRLTHTFRFGDEIAAVAAAVRDGNPEAALAALSSAAHGSRLVEVDLGRMGPVDIPELREDVCASGARLVAAARAGDISAALVALDAHRLLCAHRSGPYGVGRWSRQVEDWLRAAIPDYAADGEWYVGRPLLVTRNLPELGVFNGDTGVIIATPKGPRAAFARGGEPMLMAPAQLDGVQTVHAMTVHKSQGSQFEAVSLVLPEPSSPLLTRELLYTALTRASRSVRVLGTPEAVRAAIERPALRASGLGFRNSGGQAPPQAPPAKS